MTNSIKISQLPAATTPLTGAEQLPVVQAGVTKVATVAQVAAVAQILPGANKQILFNDNAVTGAANAWWDDTNDRLGLGATKSTPARQLDMSGSIKLEQSTTSDIGVVYKDSERFIHDYKASGANGSNTFVGQLAGNFTASTGGVATNASYNTGLGSYALQLLTQGHSNTATGFLAGYALTTGYQNVLIGRQAGQDATSGFNNVVLGYLAGVSLTTGSGNVLVGTNAGISLGAGSSNVYIGLQAGQNSNASGNVGIGAQALVSASSTTGPNIAIGVAAMTATTTGYHNIAVGSATLRTMTDAQGNIAIGPNALEFLLPRPDPSNGADLRCMFNIAIGPACANSMTTGYENILMGNSVALNATTAHLNTGIGSEVLGQLTTAAGNTAYGVAAGQGITTGGGNTLIGIGAGGINADANAHRTGTNCVFLGAYAMPGSTTQRTYMTVIGTEATGDRDNSIYLGRLATDVVLAGATILGARTIANAGYTVAQLPAASSALRGARAYVTDATAPTFLGTQTGGGAVVCPVFCNGSAWVSG